ncbi:MAG: DUF1868 domain-containing protein [Legionellaceae bacterium]|nr:DUF1868 domain-containing protein [Legionellaceae bacterium]
MPKYKLDPQGHYLFYPGYTVICKLNLDEGFDAWCNIYNTLIQNKSVTDHYSILPLSSWHVTAINLFTKEAVEECHEEWDDYVAAKKSFFNELSQILKQDQIAPTLTYSKLYTEGALQIDVKLDRHSRERIEALAKQYHYEHHIPSHFHVTLGYQYKALRPKYLAELKTALAPRIEDYVSQASPESRQLKPAQLCYFENMLAYTPFEPHSCLDVSSTLISMFSRREHHAATSLERHVYWDVTSALISMFSRRTHYVDQEDARNDPPKLT